MNFDFSEEQTMLRDSVARFVQDDYDFYTRRDIVASEAGMSRENWKTFAELGWLSVPFDEEHGGFGGGPVDLMVMMEEFGKGLVVEPYFPTVVLFGGLLRAAGSDSPEGGSTSPALSTAASSAPSPISSARAATRSPISGRGRRPDGDGYVLNGEKVVVSNGANANTLIVAARSAGEQSERAGHQPVYRAGRR
jgi:alkylation response protein AidB-like acyl-CoA dehydrogenase